MNKQKKWQVAGIILLAAGGLYLSRVPQPEVIAPETIVAEPSITDEMPPVTIIADGGRGTIYPIPQPYQSPIDFAALQAVNPDIVGWIYIPGTAVDYPIVQGTDNDYYLTSDFNRNKSKHGAIYLDYESDSDMDGYHQVIYGHNMRDGSMFKDIVKFKNQEFFNQHQFFYIYTPDRTIYLKAVSCYYDQAHSSARKTRFESQQAFDVFAESMVSPCTFSESLKTPVESLFTLITCSYELEDARTFLLAVPVAEEEAHGHSDNVY